MEYYDDFGVAAPEVLAKSALLFFVRFNGALSVEPKRHKSEASPPLEFLGYTGTFRDDGGNVIATLTPPEEKIAKLVELAQQLGVQGTASLAA